MHIGASGQKLLRGTEKGGGGNGRRGDGAGLPPLRLETLPTQFFSPHQLARHKATGTNDNS